MRRFSTLLPRNCNKSSFSFFSSAITRNMSTTSEAPLIVRQNQNLLVLELNRPKALNALSLEMCNEIKSLLVNRINSADSTVSAFLVKGNGGKAFCAGGDVKSIWQELGSLESNQAVIGTGKAGFLHTDFFRQEYIMNYLLGTSIKPQISLWDGIVMGGGVGVSVLGEFRVATEKSMFAMPETAIGLFPDVGSSAWLPHLADGYGNYIGLTGTRLNAADLIHTGIATHYIDSEKLVNLEGELENIPVDPAESRKQIKNILDRYQSISSKPDDSNSAIAANAILINKCFGEQSKSVEEIIKKLSDESSTGNEWASKTLKSLQKMSPTSMKITFAQLKKGKELDLQGCLKMEFRMIMKCMHNNEFKEGVRAVLIDRDNAPKWNPSSLEEVTEDIVNNHFVSLGENELNVF